MPKWFARAANAWRAAQVELQGQYSVERLYRVRAYSLDATTVRCVLVLLATPLPCLLVSLAIECIPLRDPNLGPSMQYSLPFYTRAFFVTQIVDFLVLFQCRYLLPTLPTSITLMMASSCVAALGAVGSVYAMAMVIGFPLPFTLLLGSPISSVLLGICFWAMWGKFFRQNSDKRRELLNYLNVVCIQVTMTYVYPAYTFVFVRLSGVHQILFTTLLPGIKLVTKNWISYLFRDKPDLKSDMIVFNADAYHSIFVSWCMNSRTSTYSTSLLMVMDVAEGLVALHDVTAVLRRIEVISGLRKEKGCKMDSTPTRSHKVYPIVPVPCSSMSMIDLAIALWEIDVIKCENSSVRKDSDVQSPARYHSSSLLQLHATSTHQTAVISRSKTFSSIQPSVQLLPTTMNPGTTDISSSSAIAIATKPPNKHAHYTAACMLTKHRHECLRLVLKLFHLSEFLLIIEFTEVIIPAIYCVYLSAVYYLPNRGYFDTIRELDDSKLQSDLTNVAIYVLLEMASLLMLMFFLQRKLGVAPVKQLAFVLDSQWQMVQSKLVLWVTFAVQSRLEHFGTDFSFQFKWL